MKIKIFTIPIFLLMLSIAGFAQSKSNPILDCIAFGNALSEAQHGFTGPQSHVIVGGLNEPARILLPPAAKNWQGNDLFFNIKIDPNQQNYITSRFWGGDVNPNRIYFVVGNQQIGSRHLGDVDMLDIGSDFPFYNGRFFYTTTPLPLALTKGKTELRLEIRSQGPIWAYGSTWDAYQKDMVEPSRGIYKIYTHLDGAFVPSADEKQGTVPPLVIRKEPGKNVLEDLKQRVNNEIDKLIKSTKPLNQMQMSFLAKTYRVKWSNGYKNKDVITQIINSLDELYKAYKFNPKLAYSEPSTPNPDWFGFGPAAQTVYLLRHRIENKIDKTIDDGTGNKLTRRAALADMFLTSRTLNEKTRRQYTNQTMIKDLYGIYYCNKALLLIDASKALPEKDEIKLLYEAVGLEPWRGSLTDTGFNYAQGHDYWQLTKKGLTKELGFVGNYGEVTDWCVELYEATRPSPEQSGDARIKTQIEKIALARSYFRYPMLDNDGNNAMRQEVVVGWRDMHYPGDVTYAQRPSWDGGPLQIVTATLHPKLVGFAHQMFDDNQFFYSLEERMKDKGFRVTVGLLPVPEQYEIAKAQKPTGYKLPMSEGQPDFVFSDEEDGVVAIKNGQEIFYVSLYWRARNSINNLARVHAIAPNYDRIATVFINEKFDSSGLFYTMPDYTNFAFGNGGVKYPDSLHLAYAGQLQPIAKIPAGIAFKPGQEHPLAGRADYYEMHYGNYIVAMNSSATKTFELDVPAAFEHAIDLASQKKISINKIKLGPSFTVVLYKNN